jgi:hypothetical protein
MKVRNVFLLSNTLSSQFEMRSGIVRNEEVLFKWFLSRLCLGFNEGSPRGFV